ncbi:MAG: division/cell wall cluster transcriptional repressor MraZ [Marinilabiliaceae bacterium]|nr:division/cell wall cluster transcriptional repressor MraZ [Marinilabiliaceae bacterium]
MITFVGDFQCKLDGKGRFVLPAAFKKVLNEKVEERLVVRKDLFESCLVLFPYSEWEQELNRIRTKLNIYNREHSRFLRDFFKGSVELSMDANGRLLVPKRLLDLVGVDRDVVLMGVDNKIELWDLELYDSQVVNSDDLGGLAEKILGNLNGLNE